MTDDSPPPLPAHSPGRLAALQRLRKISRLLDNAVAIPGTNYRVGLDPLLGLLPGGGDIVGSVLSGYIVLEAARFGVPRETLVRMVWNIIVETIIGTVPAIGDVFDLAWKANAMNMRLLESHINAPHHTNEKADRWFVALLLIGLAVVVIGAGVITIAILQFLWRAIAG